MINSFDGQKYLIYFISFLVQEFMSLPLMMDPRLVAVTLSYTLMKMADG